MSANRIRLIAAAAVLVVLFSAGIVWLVRTAGAETGTPAAEWQPAPSSPSAGLSGDPTTGSGGPAATRPGGTDPGGTKPGGADPGDSGPGGTPSSKAAPKKNPPRPVHEINVSGPLGGGIIDDPCAVFVNDYQIDVSVLKVIVPSDEVRLRPGPCEAALPNSSYPTDKINRTCDGKPTLAPGTGCYTGVAMRDPDRIGNIKTILKLRVRAVCASPATAPCSDSEVTRLSPSAANPVKIQWTTGCESICEATAFGKQEPDPGSSEQTS